MGWDMRVYVPSRPLSKNLSILGQWLFVWFLSDTIVLDLTKLQANPSSMQVDGECHQKCNRNCNKKKSESLITSYINDYFSYNHRKICGWVCDLG